MRTKIFLVRTTPLTSLAALLLLTPLLGGARGCTGEDVPIGAHDAGPSMCAPADCGPAPGAPAILCEDGSIGGNTGVCQLDAATGTCGWEFRECPTTVGCGGHTMDPTAATCADGFYCAYAPEAICGAADAPGVCRAVPDACPAIYGPVCGCDGVTYDNECVAAAARTSVMRPGPCEMPPPGECAPGECGPPLRSPAILCEDGSIGGNTGRCIRDPATRSCGWEIRECPPPPGGTCAPGECGPPLGAPAIMCEDGSIGGNTGRCLRDAATGMCGWEFRDCPTTTSCGGLVPPGMESTCPPGFYCAYSLDAMCGAADAPGVCTAVPDACSLEFGPVCGCDGVTYDNACFAASSSTGVLHPGPCDMPPPPPIRLCLADADCAAAGATGFCDTSVCYTAPCPPGMACPAVCYGVCAPPMTDPGVPGAP